MPAGYSGTPLAKKLGYKEGCRAFLLGAPGGYAALVAPLPDGVTFTKTARAVDLAHIFVRDRKTLEKELPRLMTAIGPKGAIWVSWPKKASKVETDVAEDVIREIALPIGLVDVKVCAVDEVWSGLKLVIRKALR